MSAILAGASVILGVVFFFIAVLLMEVQGFVAIAYGAMVLMLGPILLPFGIHENTEAMAWQYVKAWLTYGILYLPMCIIAMKICSILITVQATQMNTNILGSWGGMEALIVQTFSVLAAPLAVIGIVFIPNAVLNKVL
jgi:type IV secretory pathway TrbL component